MPRLVCSIGERTGIYLYLAGRAILAMRPSLRAEIFRVSAIVMVCTAFAPAKVDAQLGIFVGPPVPVASLPYSIRVVGSTSSPPITVDNITVGVNGQFVDVTFYLNHGSDISSVAGYQGTVAGPPLVAGIYTFRQFTRERFFGQGDYSEPGAARYSITVIVTAASNVGDAIEYYYPVLNHYFMTALPAEIAALDGGAFAGWSRTGQKLSNVYLADPSTEGVPAPVTPVCRFYGLPSAGLDTHFFSASPAECAAVEAKWPDIWILETVGAFYVYLPNTVDGTCPDGTVPVYRVYNNRPDANHRYMTSLVIRQQMIAQFWAPEGYGNLGVVMCINGP